jgi:drug/metabolite transporter (DMT)-like permease
MLYLLTATLILCLSFGLVGNILSGLPAAWLATARLAIAAVVFLPFARRVPLRLGLALGLVGAVQFGLMSLAYLSSFHHLKSHEVALFTVMTPVYVAVLNDLICRQFDRANLLSALLAVIGAGIILWKGVPSRAPLLGFLLVEASNLCFASGQIAYREILRRTPQPPADHRVFFWLYLGGLCALAPFGLHDALAAGPQPTPLQVTALLYLGVLVSGLSYYLWNSGARRVSAGVLAVMNNLKVPLGVAASLLLFGERIHVPGLLAGTLLVLAALIPVLIRRRKGLQ